MCSLTSFSLETIECLFFWTIGLIVSPRGFFLVRSDRIERRRVAKRREKTWSLAEQHYSLSDAPSRWRARRPLASRVWELRFSFKHQISAGQLLKGQGHVLRMRELPIESWKVPAEFFNFVQSATSRWRRLVVAVTEGKRETSGRKRIFRESKEAKKEWERCRKRIYLETNHFKSWLQAKFIAGYEACTDSAFAAHLLSVEFRRR